MRWGGARALGLCASLVCTFSGLPGATPASPIAEAAALFKQKHYAEAKALLEPLASAQPPDPSACYYLAMTLQEMGGPLALDNARTLLGKAVKRAPDNEAYLAEYAGVCLLMADRDTSFALAMEGRNAMSRAISENPADLEAREGLMTFYAQAPWPLGDADKAFTQAEEISRRDPKRGAAAFQTIAGIFKRDGRGERAQSAAKAAQNLARANPQ